MQQIAKNLFFTSKNLTKLLSALKINGMHPRLIGGCVRDALAGIEIKDIDIATPLLPNTVLDILGKHNIKAIPTGINFGTITAVVGDETFEITSLRKDINCDGRHAVVEYTTDFSVDAERRDFTINTLSYCPFEHIIYDYHGGLEDLANRKVRFIGQAAARIKEDYLRILRFFRFSSNYASVLDEEGYRACSASKDGIKQLSKERIHAETNKILTSKQAKKMLEAIIKADINLFNDLKINLNYDFSNSLNATYALLLFENDQASLNHDLHTLGFSNKMMNAIIDLSGMLNAFSHFALIEAWIDGKKMEDYLECAYCAGMITQSYKNELANKFQNSPPQLPVNGNDLMDLGLQNKQVGQSLQKLKSYWIKSDFSLSKAELLQMVITND
jgi:poly(A) polymerase